MKRVLVVATSRKTRGGITSVIKAHEKGPQWNKFHCHWVQTHRDGPKWRKILYMIYAYFDFTFRIPFYDLIHFHISLSTTVKRKLPLFKLAKKFGKKTIIHLHCGTQIDEIWNNDYHYMFQHADKILVLSNTLMQKIESKIAPTNNIEVLFNPCPIVTITETPKLKEILFSGTLYEGKGYKDLIRAFSVIAKEYPNWKLVFAGNGEIEEGRQLAKELKIDNQIEFLGWIAGTEKDNIFNRASIFCLPSYAEGFPMAVLDAWAYGLPVITTPVGGIPDIAKDGENMLIFEPGDIKKLVSNLSVLIEDEVLRRTMSNESFKLATNKFNMKTINTQLGKIYGDLLIEN